MSVLYNQGYAVMFVILLESSTFPSSTFSDGLHFMWDFVFPLLSQEVKWKDMRHQ